MASHQNPAAPKVFLSPFVLSTIMLDNSNSSGDQEGFLLGKTYKSVRFEINDQSMCNTQEDLLISVFSAYPCGGFLSFYDSNGDIDIEFIQNFLGDRINCVIGWYRFRRNVPPYPSAREAIVHKQLVNIFAGNLLIGDNYFVYGVFGSSTTENFATHTYDYAFYIERPDRLKKTSSCRFLPLAMSMLNLIDTKTKYRSGSLASSFVNSQTFDSVLNISWSFESCWQTEDGIQQMHKLLRDKCSNLAEELTASECVNASIEDDIKRLEAELDTLSMSDKQSSSELGETTNSNAHQENIPPGNKSITVKPSKKRILSELIDYESEKQHPVYGKFFEQSRSQEPENTSQASSDASDNNYYILPPQKKFKVLQEHKRVIDHDYSSASDEDSHKYAQDANDRAEELYEVSFPSETDDYASTDDSKSIQDVEIEVPSNISGNKKTEHARSLCLDNQTNVILSQTTVSSQDTVAETTGALDTRTLNQPGSPCVPFSSLKAHVSPEVSGIVSPEVIVVTSQMISAEKDVETILTSTQDISEEEECESSSVSTVDLNEDRGENANNQTEEANVSQVSCTDDKSNLKKGSKSPLKSCASGRPYIIYVRPANKEEDSSR